jgi:hypothetical protein
MVNATARTTGPGWSAVRIRLGPDGRIDVSAAPAHAVRTPTPLHSVIRRDGLWRHRWAAPAHRDGHDNELNHDGHDGLVPLFVATDGTVLETGSGNVFLLMTDGTLITPPLRDDLLPGVTRRALLDYARDEQRPVQIRGFDVTEMTANTAFWTNSISGVVPVASVDGVPLPRSDEQIAAFARHLIGGPE